MPNRSAVMERRLSPSGGEAMRLIRSIARLRRIELGVIEGISGSTQSSRGAAAAVGMLNDQLAKFCQLAIDDASLRKYNALVSIVASIKNGISSFSITWRHVGAAIHVVALDEARLIGMASESSGEQLSVIVGMTKIAAMILDGMIEFAADNMINDQNYIAHVMTGLNNCLSEIVASDSVWRSPTHEAVRNAMSL